MDAPEPQWLDEEERRTWLALVALATRLPAALDAHMQRDAGMTHFEYHVMAALDMADEGTLRPSDLAGAVGSSSPASPTCCAAWRTRAGSSAPGPRRQPLQPRVADPGRAGEDGPHRAGPRGHRAPPGLRRAHARAAAAVGGHRGTGLLRDRPAERPAERPVGRPGERPGTLGERPGTPGRTPGDARSADGSYTRPMPLSAALLPSPSRPSRTPRCATRASSCGSSATT
ncbi:hypothetical protein NKH77_31690 [Streptomyces sp. M19]